MEKYLGKIKLFSDLQKFKTIIKSNKTPLIVYDFDNTRKILKIFHDVFSDRKYIKIFFAVKSNNNPRFLMFLSKYVDGFDTASIEEYNLVKKFGKKISFTSPGVAITDIETLINDNDVRVDFDSINQMTESIKRITMDEIGIRLNIPDFNIATSRFGISLNQDTISELKKLTIPITSIHFHSEQKDENYTESILNSIELLIETKTIDANSIKTINLGGGFLNLLIDDKLSYIADFIEILKEQYFNINDNIQFIIEPGSAISIFSAYLLTEVLNIKNSDGKNSVVLNASSYNLSKWVNPIPIYYTSQSQQKKLYEIDGNTCYEKDIFLKDVSLKEMSINDKIILFPFGAYTRSNYSNLHSMSLPLEAYYENGVIEYE